MRSGVQVSYAAAARSLPGRAMIHLIETAGGRGHLMRRAAGYECELAEGEDFWRLMCRRFGLTLDLMSGALDDIPRDGPLVVIANHPYGLLDGLVVGHVLSGLRGDFRILANSVVAQAPQVAEKILPIDFAGTPAAQAVNLATRRAAVEFLRAGGAVAVFPGGTVSTAAHPFGRAMDPDWRLFPARMIARSGATVVPVYFDGANSRLFQVASHLHMTLRLALLLREFRARVGAPVRLAIGRPIGPEVLAPMAGDPKQMMEFLRRATYSLSPTPLDVAARGHEFEERYRR